MTRITLFLVLLTGVLGGDVVAAERVYTWTDQDGIVHYSDKPTGQQATPMLVSPATPGKPAANPPPAEPAGKNAEKKSGSDQDAVFVANPDEDPAVRAKNCEQSRRYVNTIRESEGRRLYVTREDGTRHWLSDEERAQKLEAGNKAIKKWCD